MTSLRRIAKLFQAQPTIEGAGVHLKRAFGYAQVPQLDPFLMLDDFHASDPAHYTAGFPWHPHRGIETITYVLEGLVEHGDSMGNQGVIGAGDVQWMTAGSGIIHQEMPRQSPSGTLWGLQLWANLPAERKMMPPRYRDVQAAQIPALTLEGGVAAKVIAGSLGGVPGPVRDIVIEPEMLDIRVPGKGTWQHAIPAGHIAFAYVLAGQGYFDEQGALCRPETVVLFEHAGTGVRIANRGDGELHLLFVSGKPLGEPVAWGGPIVMNTQEELRLAFEEYKLGTFIKHR